jgi:hypothetical protein
MSAASIWSGLLTRRRNDLANRLAKIGCDVNKFGNDWMMAGRFESAELKPKKKTEQAPLNGARCQHLSVAIRNAPS